MKTNKKYTNLQEIIQTFSDENYCKMFLAKHRWSGKPVCPKCKNDVKIYDIENGKRYKCSLCLFKFSVTVGTIFENSKMPLSKWFIAMYFIMAHKKGISSCQLASDLNVTQKTAWFMLHRIRETLKTNSPDLLTGIVEVDETFMGGKEKNMNAKKRATLKAGRGYINKTPVFGMLERQGEMRTRVVDNVNGNILKPIIRENVNNEAIIMSDEFGGYKDLGKEFAGHEVVAHSRKEYARGTIHTNTIEGFWSLMKRGINGIQHSVSEKHLHRYCNEYAFRYNTKSIEDVDRFNVSFKKLEKRLKYKNLIA